MTSALLAVVLLADAGLCRREPAMAVERLGPSYRYLGAEDDRGLAVEAWQNETWGRRELWHKPGGEYFLRVDGSTYVRGRLEGADWVTDPSVRLVRRGDNWRRLERLPVRR